ncbi:MAG: CpsD/CapB family tyrosine-protein kinase, partial [Firmicutes bacterium]|nr:CpsD/CapB family tyrosine-protein kinase [Bacillota bacterium]
RHTSAKKVIGLSEVLTGMVSVGDAVYQTQYPNFYLMMSGQFPPNPTELLSNDNFRAIISGARNVFDYILIDTPPIGEVIDAAVVATHSDGTILVLDGESREKEARYCAEQIQKGGSKILGVVRNNVKGDGHAHYGQKKHGYGYR